MTEAVVGVQYCYTHTHNKDAHVLVAVVKSIKSANHRKKTQIKHHHEVAITKVAAISCHLSKNTSGLMQNSSVSAMLYLFLRLIDSSKTCRYSDVFVMRCVNTLYSTEHTKGAPKSVETQNTLKHQ